jgi:hypothetical protein
VTRTRVDLSGDPVATLERALADVEELRGEFPDPNTLGRKVETAPRDSHWMRWWEANRENYWPEPADTDATQNAARQFSQHHELAPAAAAALERAAKSRQPGVRANAAMALALTRHPNAEKLLQALTDDPDDATAVAAWAGLGLIGSDVLMKEPTSARARPRDAIGWALGIGLHPEPNEVVWDGLVKQARESAAPEARRLAVWAMRVHHAPPTHDLALELIQTTNDRDLFTEAAIALGASNGPESARVLTDLIRVVNWVRELPLVANDIDFYIAQKNKVRRPAIPILGQPHDYRAAAMLGAMQMVSTLGQTADAIRAPIGGRLMAFTQKYQLELGLQPPKVMPPEEPHGMLALGLTGSEGDAKLLYETLHIDYQPLSHPVNDPTALDSSAIRKLHRYPSRATAALALGLLVRRTPTLDGAGVIAVDSGEALPDVINAVGGYLNSPVESDDLRTACAVGLGLAGNRAAASQMKAKLRHIKAGEQDVYGFIILGLGLLGDPETVKLASAALGPGTLKIKLDNAGANTGRAASFPLEELIARRAIVDGLAALGDPRGLPILFDQFGRDDMLTIDAARGIARCLRPAVMQQSPKELEELLQNYTQALVSAIDDGGANRMTMLAVTCLGTLYAEPYLYQRLGTITAGGDYAVKFTPALANGRIDLTRAYPTAVMRLSNPFYAHLMR